ncbi:MAG: Gfo/Idh/MocA family oxidoreductase [Phycisphaerales bacterium]|nr:Gfo/Idh/MocA family oxidoreductase [Phycisphaerales bacterium]
MPACAWCATRSGEAGEKRVIKLGMIGGGRGAFIGAVHRLAIRLDGEAELVAGALASTPDAATQSGRELGLDPARTYASWRELIAGESKRTGTDRLEAIVIVTPNHTHFEIAKACLDAPGGGFNVIIDKPLCHSVQEVADLERLTATSGRLLAVTYNYIGYPLVRCARELVHAGELGTIRKVFVEYHQGWLATDLASTGQKQASWRSDPAKAGGGAISDIGSHAENLAAFVTGLEVDSLAADLTSFVPGRRVDDDAAILIRFKPTVPGAPPARAVLTASQVCVGEENGLSLRVYGDKGGLSWRQEQPNELVVNSLAGERRIITRGSACVGSGAAALSTRLPPGHPEGFIEAFANIYRGIFEAIRAQSSGAALGDLAKLIPTVREGARGVRFIHAAQESSKNNAAWTRLDSL